MSIFVLGTKWVKNRSKLRRTVLFFTHGVGASVAVIVCYDKRAYDVDERGYGRSKFVNYVSIFGLPTKYLETMSKRHRTLMRVAHGVRENMMVRVAVRTPRRGHHMVEIWSFEFWFVMCRFLVALQNRSKRR